MKKLSGLVAMILCFSACSSSFEIQVSPSQELLEAYGYCPSLEVDVALASENDVLRFTQYPVEMYYDPKSSLRSFLEPITLRFAEDDVRAKLITSDDPVFAKWQAREPTHLVMIVNLPKADKDIKTLDTRKFLLKLEDGMFAANDDLYIKIGATGLIKTTKERAKEDGPTISETQGDLDVTLVCKTKKGQKELSCTVPNEELKESILKQNKD